VNPPDCAFCRIVAREAPAEIVLDEPDVVAFLDARPVFKGHTLVVPRAHVVMLAEVSGDVLAALFGAVQRFSMAIPAALGAQGVWVSVNNVVSQSVPHVHVHVVPRTKGDGLRGFFWPRTKYADAADTSAHGDRIRAALDGLTV
jgi:histidine triad (HIT) family protein